MKHFGPFIVVLAVALGCAKEQPQPMAPQVSSVTERSPGRVMQTNTATATAIVDKIDQKNRIVTLRMADGRKETLRAGDEVRNLAQVKVGDEVLVGYLESVAIEVNKSGGELGAVAGADAARAPLGEKPAGVAAQSIKVTAKIVKIDREHDEVTLEGKEGNRAVIDIRDPQHYEAIAVGDLVDITYTEAVAVSVEPTSAR